MQKKCIFLSDYSFTFCTRRLYSSPKKSSQLLHFHRSLHPFLSFLFDYCTINNSKLINLPWSQWWTTVYVMTVLYRENNIIVAFHQVIEVSFDVFKVHSMFMFCMMYNNRGLIWYRTEFWWWLINAVWLSFSGSDCFIWYWSLYTWQLNHQVIFVRWNSARMHVSPRRWENHR